MIALVRLRCPPPGGLRGCAVSNYDLFFIVVDRSSKFFVLRPFSFLVSSGPRVGRPITSSRSFIDLLDSFLVQPSHIPTPLSNFNVIIAVPDVMVSFLEFGMRAYLEKKEKSIIFIESIFICSLSH